MHSFPLSASQLNLPRWQDDESFCADIHAGPNGQSLKVKSPSLMRKSLRRSSNASFCGVKQVAMNKPVTILTLWVLAKSAIYSTILDKTRFPLEHSLYHSCGRQPLTCVWHTLDCVSLIMKRDARTFVCPLRAVVFFGACTANIHCEAVCAPAAGRASWFSNLARPHSAVRNVFQQLFEPCSAFAKTSWPERMIDPLAQRV